jgi:hypothetical protein
MTRTDVMASSRPQTAAATPMRRGSAGILRRLSLLPVVLLIAMAIVGPGTAFGAKETKSGYNQEPNKPSTGTSPSKETSTPKTTSKETEPSSTTAAPTAEAAKASTLPFTGFDLRWSVGAGLLLMGAGFSIVVVQRRQRREH